MRASSPGGGAGVSGGGLGAEAWVGPAATDGGPGVSAVEGGRGVALSGGGVGTNWQARRLAKTASEKPARLSFGERPIRGSIAIIGANFASLNDRLQGVIGAGAS